MFASPFEPFVSPYGSVGVREDDERLAEEERHDRQVVAEQPPRRGAEEEPEQRADQDGEQDRVLRGPVVRVDVPLLVVRAGQERVGVGAEAEERDVAEVEEPGEADDDVQPEREQRVDQDEEAVVEEVPLADEGEERDEDRRRQQRELPGRRQHPQRCWIRPRAPERRCGPLVGLGDPRVDADLARVRRLVVGWCGRWRLGHRLDLLQRRGTEQPARPDEHDPDQDPEDDEVGDVAVQVAPRPGLDEADEDAAEHRAGDAADAADDRGGEALQAREEAHQVVDLAEEQAEHHACRAGERRADEERGCDHPVGVDAHHRRRLAVERDRAHRLPELRPARRARAGPPSAARRRI